jgi:superfamily II DNA or RNA helicase
LTRRITLATVQIAAEGLDVPYCNTICFLSMLKDVQQATGRVLRDRCSARLPPVVIDLVDSSVGMSAAMARSRLRCYEMYGEQVVFHTLREPRTLAICGRYCTTSIYHEQQRAAAEAKQSALKRRH